MKKFFKILLIVFVVILAFLIAIPYLFKDKILDETQKIINENVNAKVEFEDVNLSIFKSFPRFYFALEGLQVIGIKEFEKDTLVKIQILSLDLDLMSVITGDKIKIKSVVLEQANINVKVLKGGKANWDIAKASEETEELVDTTAEATKFHLGLEEFAIRNLNLVYDDEDMDMFTEIKNLNYTLKGDFTESFTALKNDLSIDVFTFIY